MLLLYNSINEWDSVAWQQLLSCVCIMYECRIEGFKKKTSSLLQTILKVFW